MTSLQSKQIETLTPPVDHSFRQMGGEEVGQIHNAVFSQIDSLYADESPHGLTLRNRMQRLLESEGWHLQIPNIFNNLDRLAETAWRQATVLNDPKQLREYLAFKFKPGEDSLYDMLSFTQEKSERNLTKLEVQGALQQLSSEARRLKGAIQNFINKNPDAVSSVYSLPPSELMTDSNTGEVLIEDVMRLISQIRKPINISSPQGQAMLLTLLRQNEQLSGQLKMIDVRIRVDEISDRAYLLIMELREIPDLLEVLRSTPNVFSDTIALTETLHGNPLDIEGVADALSSLALLAQSIASKMDERYPELQEA